MRAKARRRYDTPGSPALGRAARVPHGSRGCSRAPSAQQPPDTGTEPLAGTAGSPGWVARGRRGAGPAAAPPTAALPSGWWRGCSRCIDGEAAGAVRGRAAAGRVPVRTVTEPCLPCPRARSVPEPCPQCPQLCPQCPQLCPQCP